jgi:hypothetical protein
MLARLNIVKRRLQRLLNSVHTVDYVHVHLHHRRATWLLLDLLAQPRLRVVCILSDHVGSVALPHQFLL